MAGGVGKYVPDYMDQWHSVFRAEEDGWWLTICGTRVFGTAEPVSELPEEVSRCRCVSSFFLSHEGIWEHQRGSECSGGWCGGEGYPKSCPEPGCTGFMHADFGDEGYYGYWLSAKCDTCGESELSGPGSDKPVARQQPVAVRWP